MRKQILLLITLVLMLVPGVLAIDCMGFPHFFYGGLTVNGEDAEIGTQMRAVVFSEIEGTYTTTVLGQYGAESGNDKLAVTCPSVGDTIYFEVYVGDTWIESPTTAECACGTTTNLDIAVAVEDNDGDGYTSEQGDCDDNDEFRNPGMDETCNGIDDDCNDLVDDGLDAPLNTMQDGVCAQSTQTCNGAEGWADDYSAVADYEATEATCDGLDNDCDGQVDNGLDAPLNTLQEGVCSESTQTCAGANGWGDDYSAVADYEATEATCDGLDNDCDGQVDNGLDAPLNTLQDGVCAQSTQTCDGANGWFSDYSGVASYEADETTCDELDNDCDGTVDEGCEVEEPECTLDSDCDYGYECNDGTCELRDSYCNLYWPVQLYSGWNMVVFPSCTAMPITTGLASIDGNYGDIFVLEQGVWMNYNPDVPAQMNDFSTLDAMQAMYIFMNTDDILYVYEQPQ